MRSLTVAARQGSVRVELACTIRAPGPFASKLDAARLRHSRVHSEAGQHPLHQHNISHEEKNRYEPFRHRETSTTTIAFVAHRSGGRVGLPTDKQE